MDPNAAAFVMFGILSFFYLLPAIIASMRRHHNQLAIWVLTIFLGWTFVGWVGALVWGFTVSPPQRPAAA